MPDAAPVVEAPPAAPAAAPESPAPPGSGFDDAFSAIESMGREDGTPEPPERPTPGDGRKRDETGKFLPKEKAPEKPPEKVVEKPKPAEAEKPSKKPGDGKIDNIKEFRANYEATKAKAEAYEKELAELKKAPKEWPEKKTYEEKLAEREKLIEEHKKRVEQYETELQFTNFTKSQAYKDQYEKPYINAWKAGQAETATLEIVERKDETEQVTQPGRDATAADFDAIMSIANNRDAVKRAVQLFGDAAPVVLAHRKAIHEKEALANEAIKEFQTKGAEREKTMREQQEKQSKEYSSMVDNFRNAAIEKYPKFFKSDPADPEGNKYLESGSHLMERVLKNGAPLKEGETQMTGEQYAIAVAAVRNKASAFDRVAHLATTRARRIAELEKELEQFKASKPGNGNGNGRAAPAAEEDPLAMIDKLGRER